ncbi:MAG: DUF1653 domain-containing protein [Nanoarchaeota archaeon]|nr:DUF1653 domain-containing protein [Nanoarchaeota archaeon]
MQEPKPGEKYLHFKNMEVEIICIARDCENPDKKFVVYKHSGSVKGLTGETTWIRELKDFMGFKKFKEEKEIGGKTYKAGDKVKRFALIQ